MSQSLFKQRNLTVYEPSHLRNVKKNFSVVWDERWEHLHVNHSVTVIKFSHFLFLLYIQVIQRFT